MKLGSKLPTRRSILQQHEEGLQWPWSGCVLVTCLDVYMQLFLFKMNSHLDRYIAVSVPNGFRETAPSGSSFSSYESLIDLSPSRCRVPSAANHPDTVPESQSSRVAYNSLSLPTNGVTFSISEAASIGTVGHPPVHYWSGKQW